MNCGDFIRTRTIKQVLPHIYSFLKLNYKRSLICSNKIESNSSGQSIADSLANDSSIKTISIKNSSNAFFFSLDYRLQQLLLDNLGKLAFNIRLSRKDLWPLISNLIEYCNDKQPIELRVAALASLNEIEQLDYYAVHFFKNYYHQ